MKKKIDVYEHIKFDYFINNILPKLLFSVVERSNSTNSSSSSITNNLTSKPVNKQNIASENPVNISMTNTGYENYLKDTIFEEFPSKRFKVVDNLGDGNCLYDAVLDSARMWNLPPEMDIVRLFPGNISRRRPREHQRLMRKQLVSFLKSKGNEIDKRAIKRIEKDGEWAFTDEINTISKLYKICIILHSEEDNAWSVSTPDIDINECKHYIVIRNLKGGIGKYKGLHYVALVPPSSPSSEKTKTIRIPSFTKNDTVTRSTSAPKNTPLVPRSTSAPTSTLVPRSTSLVPKSASLIPKSTLVVPKNIDTIVGDKVDVVQTIPKKSISKDSEISGFINIIDNDDKPPSYSIKKEERWINPNSSFQRYLEKGELVKVLVNSQSREMLLGRIVSEPIFELEEGKDIEKYEYVWVEVGMNPSEIMEPSEISLRIYEDDDAMNGIRRNPKIEDDKPFNPPNINLFKPPKGTYINTYGEYVESLPSKPVNSNGRVIYHKLIPSLKYDEYGYATHVKKTFKKGTKINKSFDDCKYAVEILSYKSKPTRQYKRYQLVTFDENDVRDIVHKLSTTINIEEEDKICPICSENEANCNLPCNGSLKNGLWEEKADPYYKNHKICESCLNQHIKAYTSERKFFENSKIEIPKHIISCPFCKDYFNKNNVFCE